MKVLHVIPSMWDGDGGPTHALAAMEKSLLARGVEVETATTDHAGAGRRNGRSGRVEEHGAIRHYFAKRTEFYKVAAGLRPWLARHVRDYDLVHVHALFSFTSTMAARAARRAGVPYVLRPLGTLDAWGLHSRRPALKRLSLRWVEGPLLRDAAAVHFTSDTEAEQSRALHVPMNAVVIPLGLSLPSACARRVNDDMVRVLFLSRLDPKKNLEGLLHAVAQIRHEFPNLRLDIAGDGEPAYAEQLHARAAALGLTHIVQWLGRVTGDAKERAFAQADVFALPSHSENFGIAAGEALARGLPCLLGSGVAIAADVQRAGAGLAIGTSPADIAQALRSILAGDVRAAMGERARRLCAERYSLDAMGARLEQLYADIFAGTHGLPAAH